MNLENMANEIFNGQESHLQKLKRLKELRHRIEKEIETEVYDSSLSDSKVSLERCEHLISELQKKISGTESEDERVKRKISKDENNKSPEIEKMVDVSKTTKE